MLGQTPEGSTPSSPVKEADADIHIEVPRPTMKGFTPEEAQQYIEIYKQAYEKLERDGLVNFDLMATPSYYMNLARVVWADDYPINTQAYKEFNRYVRKAYEILFPSAYVESFADDERLAFAAQICKQGLLDNLPSVKSDNSQEEKLYTVNTKREYELKHNGDRSSLPQSWLEETYDKVEAGDPFCERFSVYMGKLALAAYQYFHTYEQEHHLPLTSFPDFIDRKGSNTETTIWYSFRQIVGNYGNFGNLLTGLLHAEKQVQAKGMTLRHYFIDGEGEELVAKCGFLNAFSDHIRDIILNEPVDQQSSIESFEQASTPVAVESKASFISRLSSTFQKLFPARRH